MLVAATLIGLNAASYTQKEKVPDTEFAPNRSSYNSGPTGTLALYTLLSESGRKVSRWLESADALEVRRTNAPTTFVIVGSLKRSIEEAESSALLRWVSGGGKLVVIDREPPEGIVTTSANWSVKVEPQFNPDVIKTDPSDPQQMTKGTSAAKPGQPSRFSAGVYSVMPSIFASSIKLDYYPPDPDNDSISDSGPPHQILNGNTNTEIKNDDGTGDPDDYDDPVDPEPYVEQQRKSIRSDELFDMPTPTPSVITTVDELETIDGQEAAAPFVVLRSDERNLLIAAPFGQGEIIYLADPYIVSNGGIGLADNARLALNLVESSGGMIAFDEYHHGFGANNNRFLEFFAGTPIVSIFLQCVLVFGLILFSRSVRFARPLPAVEPDRLTKLEYVTAMADMQMRTNAYDLAIENIYRDFRRRVVRKLGLDSVTLSRADLASNVAERVGAEANEIEMIFFKCEEIIAGESTNRRETYQLVKRIREIENALGMRRQAKS